MMGKARNGMWLLAALAAAVIWLMGAGTARAGDAVEDFTLNNTGGNVTIVGAGPAGSDTLVDCGGLTYDWGAYDAGTLTTANMRIQQTSGLQMRQGAAVTGTYFLTRFTSGDSAVVNNLKFVDVTSNNIDFDARLLVRDHATGAWYASANVSLVAAKSFDVDSYQWSPVTNAQTAIEDAIDIGGTLFTALTLGTPAAWPTGLDVDGGGIYVNSEHPTDSCRIGRLAFKEPIVGGVTVPDVAGMEKGAAATALTIAGLTSHEVNPKVNSDTRLNDQVVSTVPTAGLVVLPGTDVALTISNGAGEYWEWTGGADTNVATPANWTVGGSPVTPSYAPSIDSTERLAVRSGSVAWNTGFLPANNMLILNGATVTLNSGVSLDVSTGGNSQIGSGLACVGSGAGTLVVNAGAILAFRVLSIGQTSEVQAGSGSVTINGGTVTLTNTLNIGMPDNGAGAGTALLHLNGSAALMAVGANAALNSPLAVLRFTGDASGFGKITMSSTTQDFVMTSGAIQIDATNANAVLGTPQSWTLVDCGRDILDPGGVLASGVTVTPKTGTVASEWSVAIADTNPDDLVLTYTPNNPPAFTADPFTAPNAILNTPYSQSIAGDATDPDAGDTLTFEKTGGPAWLSVAPDGALTGTPGPTDVGPNAFTVKVTDSGGLLDTATMNITVNAVSAARTWKKY